MTDRWQWLLARLSRKLWVRASLLSVLAIVAALIAIALKPYIPESVSASIGADAVDHILTIIASSMLAVTTFSLGIMVSAYTAASNSATPRAATLLIEDRTSQNVLATFIGAFLYSLVGIVVLRTGAYGASGRVVLFVVTIAVIVLIVITLIRWIEHLTTLGRVSDTAGRVERATMDAIRPHLRDKYLGCSPLPELDSGAVSQLTPVHGNKIGFVQHIDLKELSVLAEEMDSKIYVPTLAGAFAGVQALAWSDKPLRDHQATRARACFTLGETRTFDQDPRFGICVLSEIASRALSPAVNDPGTAIDIISRLTRIFVIWGTRSNQAALNEPRYPRIFLPAITSDEIFNDAFAPIARDGASLVEVGVWLQKSLRTLASLGNQSFSDAAMVHSAISLQRSEDVLVIERDKETIRDLVLSKKPN